MRISWAKNGPRVGQIFRPFLHIAIGKIPVNKGKSGVCRENFVGQKLNKWAKRVGQIFRPFLHIAIGKIPVNKGKSGVCRENFVGQISTENTYIFTFFLPPPLRLSPSEKNV